MAERQRKSLKPRSSLVDLLRKRRWNSEKFRIGETPAPIVPQRRPVSAEETGLSVEAGKSVTQSLRELAHAYSDRLPIKVKVFSGLRRKTARNQFLTVEDVSFSSVITCVHREQRFSIPLSVDLKFAVLWEQEGKDDFEILTGKVFTVSNLLQFQGNEGPKVISAMQDWVRDEVTVLMRGEVLVVMKATEPATVAGAPSEIKVFSLSIKASKTLPLDCPVTFTNRAHCISLHLPDIAAYIPDPFPCRACILRHDFGLKCYPADIVALEGLERARVMKCTALGNPSKAGPPTVYRVPADLPEVEVTIVADDEVTIVADDEATISVDATSTADGDEERSLTTGFESSPEPEPALPARCQSPVYEMVQELPEECDQNSSEPVSKEASGGTGAAAMGTSGAETSTLTSPDELIRSVSPIYEQLSCVGKPAAHSGPGDGGYVAMMPDAAEGAKNPAEATSTSEYEEMKQLNLRTQVTTKKLSVIYVNDL